MEVENSNTTNAPDWDAFLESSPQGQYQQSSAWARTKACQGWRVERLLLRRAGVIRGGAQILWRNSRLGRLGYASQGPVLASGNSTEMISPLIGGLKDTARHLGLRALIVQCPPGSAAVDQELAHAGFLPNRLLRVITATWITPLEGGIKAVERRMRRRTRSLVRQAARRGVVVENGNRTHLGIFFDLMAKSCERQGVQPNPGSLSGLEAVWDAFHPGGLLRLSLARFEDRPVAGLISLRFGGKVTLWKKGSLPESLPLHPMEPLYVDALAWGCQSGDHVGDYGSLKRATAETLLSGKPLTGAMKSSRDFFNMRFGGYPVLFPQARLWIRNPLLRQFYHLGACGAVGSRLLRNRYRC